MTQQKRVRFREFGRIEKIRAASGECPNCIGQLEISTLKFGFLGTRMTFVCPNCAIVIADGWHGEKPGGTDNAKNPVRPVWVLLHMLEALDARVRYVVTFVVAAVTIAAVLRHTGHVYAGFLREELRAGALMACFAFLWL
jgi:hypothetical protein